MRRRIRWFHLEAVQPPFSMWWCLLQPGAAGRFRRLVLKGQLMAAGGARRWVFALIRRFFLWPIIVVKELRESRRGLANMGLRSPVRWLYVFLLGVVAGIPPSAYLGLELYRRRPGEALRDFVLPNEFPSVSMATRSREETAILGDKIRFFEMMSKAGIPIVPIVAIRQGDGFDVAANFHDYQSWFAKPARGHGGMGCARIDLTESGCYVVRAGTPLNSWDDPVNLGQDELTLDELLRLLAGPEFANDLIVQPNMRNALTLAAISPSGLAVVRLITGRSESGIVPIAACYCMPMRNWIVSQFGVFAQIDLDSGVLSEIADFGINGARSRYHPDTSVLIAGKVIPDWQQCMRLAMDAHEVFETTSFIGWDIAPTRNGHLVLEGNLNFDTHMLQKLPSAPLLKSPMRKVLTEMAFNRT